MSMPKYHHPEVKIVRSHVDAVLPVYKTAGAAGADLCSVESVKIYPGETRVVHTGLLIAVPDGYEAQVRSRSSSTINNLVVANSPGTIDSDYRGEIMLIMFNNGRLPRIVRAGDRLAQLVIAPVERACFTEVTQDMLTPTERGIGGLGSTGKN